MPRWYLAPRSILAALAALAGPAGCSLDLSDLTGGGGSGGAGSAAGAGGSTSCAAIVCDDFESDALATVWVPNTMGGTVSVDTVHAHSGRRALHVHVDAVPEGAIAEAFVAESKSLAVTPAPSSSFVRAYFFLPAVVDQPSTLLAFAQGASPWRGLGLAVAPPGALHINSTVMDPATGTDLDPGPPIGSWFCVELDLSFSQPQEVRVWLGDEEYTSFNRLQPTEPSPGWEFVNLGLLFFYPTTSVPALDMWIDDVVIDDKHIGCN
jgi:hypothetical protein